MVRIPALPCARVLRRLAGLTLTAGLTLAPSSPALAADPQVRVADPGNGATLTGEVPVTADATAPALALPRTGFEQRGGTSWTTMAEEQSFLRALDAASSRITVSEIARTAEGRPIQLVIAGPSRTKAEIAAGSSALFVCTQHGTEPAGREACLQRLRDHAASGDASTLLFIPTANPDGAAAGTRENSFGTDTNRDHLDLSTTEGRAIASVVRDLKPDVLGDLHEYQASGASAVLHNDPSRAHGNTDAQVTTLTGEANANYVVPALRAAGFKTGPYLAEMAPTGPNEGILSTMSGLRHVVAALVETPRLGTLSPAKRVTAQKIAIDALVKMLRERAPLLAATTAGAAQRATAEGAAGDPRYVFTSSTIAKAPCGYRLTSSQHTELQGTLDLHGVRVVASGTSWTVSMAQASEPVIPLLMDSRAAYEMTSAQRISC